MHTCATKGRSNCDPCMQFEIALWEAINRYVVTCGGVPGGHVHGNERRMEAVVAVNTVIQGALARQRIDDVVIDDLARGSNAAAKAACDRGAEIHRLRDALSMVRFALCSTTERSEDAVEMIDRVLNDKDEGR